MSTIIQFVLKNAVAYAWAGPLWILAYLLISGKASFFGTGGTGAACGQTDISKAVSVFGGASAFTFGIHWFVISWWMLQSGNLEWARFFVAYATMQMALSMIQALRFLAQAGNAVDGDHIPLRAHWKLDHPCGYDCAWNPLWPIFIISELKIPVLATLSNIIRNLMTLADFMVSLIPVLVLSLLTRLIYGVFTIPMMKNE